MDVQFICMHGAPSKGIYILCVSTNGSEFSSIPTLMRTHLQQQQKTLRD
jgi:hypothetical protein